MASISYEDIFSNFLGNVTDYNLASLNVTDAYEIMTELLHKTVSEPYIYRLFSEYILDDEIQMLTFTMATEVNEYTDQEFIKTAIGKWMVYFWLNRQVQSVTNITQMFGTKEGKWFSQSAHLSELRSLQDDAYKSARFYVLQRGYITNSYLGGG